MSEKDTEEVKSTEKVEEVHEALRALPQQWIDLLNSMPDIREEFIDDKKHNMDEMLSPYFFTLLFENDYKSCEPFFLCFERGKEVFDNLYELYGDDESAEPLKKLSDEEIEQLLIKHVGGMNYLIEAENIRGMKYQSFEKEALYHVHDMEIKKLSYKELEEEYDLDEHQDIDSFCHSSMFGILPSEEENPISAFVEPLYYLTENYNIIFYILWPLGKIDNIENPYKPYVELWHRGITPYLVNRNLLAYTSRK